MARGRSSNPSTDVVGKWFYHEDMKAPGGVNPTSTGEMLETPYHPNVAYKPVSSLPTNTAMNFRSSNLFSEVDNKRSFDADSEYFSYTHKSRILGRRHYTGNRNLHHSDTGFLHHPMDVCAGTCNRPPMVSTYGSSYHGDKKITGAVRRFPKVYNNEKRRILEPSMRASYWFKDPEAYKASTETLLGSLTPYVKHEPWKFSYQCSPKVYPN